MRPDCRRVVNADAHDLVSLFGSLDMFVTWPVMFLAEVTCRIEAPGSQNSKRSQDGLNEGGLEICASCSTVPSLRDDLSPVPWVVCRHPSSPGTG